MATIKARKQANGTTRYTAVLRLRRGTTVLHQESKTFAYRSAAITWAKHREVELENPSALLLPQPCQPSPKKGWVGPRIVLFEACSAFSR
jgi:hypothetical protein